jgi:hypothetical protein
MLRAALRAPEDDGQCSLPRMSARLRVMRILGGLPWSWLRSTVSDAFTAASTAAARTSADGLRLGLGDLGLGGRGAALHEVGHLLLGLLRQALGLDAGGRDDLGRVALGRFALALVLRRRAPPPGAGAAPRRARRGCARRGSRARPSWP